MKNFLTLALFVLLIPAALAQFTVVTGTVVDPNGLPYANGTISPILVTPGGTSATLNGLGYSPPQGTTGLDTSGSFTMRLADTTVLQPGGVAWNFQVCSAIGTVNPAIGTGSQCFKLAAPIGISGASQSITTQLHAAALALTVPGVAGNVTSVGAAAPITSTGGTTPNIGCPTCVTTVSGTAPIASSGGTTPAISLNDTVVTPGSYTNTSLTVDQKGRLTAASSGTTQTGVQAFASNHLVGTVSIPASATTWLTQAVTMPSSGCPCRAFVSYSAIFNDTGNSGAVTLWVDDSGANVFGTSQWLQNSAGGIGPGGSAAAFSPTYANNATVTFRARAFSNVSGNAIIGSTPLGGSTEASWIDIAVFTSN